MAGIDSFDSSDVANAAVGELLEEADGLAPQTAASGSGPIPCSGPGDPSYTPQIANPMHPNGDGPTILYDEGHNNLHLMSPAPLHPESTGSTATGLKKLLEADGYQVGINPSRFSQTALAGAKVLIISGATASPYWLYDEELEACVTESVESSKPAFTQQEVFAVADFVSRGGSLILIHDHTPYGSANQILASVFGVTLYNQLSAFPPSFSLHFSTADGTIVAPEHPIFQGRGGAEVITDLPDFDLTHHTVNRTDPATTLLQFPPQTLRVDMTPQGWDALSACVFLPHVSCTFEDLVAIVLGAGWTPVGEEAAFSEIRYRHSFFHPGGKVFIVGEQAKFTAKQGGGGGLNDAITTQFVLNLIRYAAGDLSPEGQVAEGG